MYAIFHINSTPTTGVSSGPKYQWYMSVYLHELITRLDEMMANITGVFGRILKIDSMKVVNKKLSGHAWGTSAWATNVGNEYGAHCVLTDSATKA